MTNVYPFEISFANESGVMDFTDEVSIKMNK